MARKYQTKSIFEPYYVSVAVILFVSIIVWYIFKKLFHKYKARSSNKITYDYTENFNENTSLKKAEANDKIKKKKPRVKPMSKPSGFIPEEHKFNVTKESSIKPSSVIEQGVFHEEKSLIETSSGFNSIIKEVTEIKDNEEIELKSILKKTSSSQKTGSSGISKKNIYLSEYERNTLYALMGLVSDTSNKLKEDSIYSVEYLFEFKYKDKVTYTDKLNNSHLVRECKKYHLSLKSVMNRKDLQRILELYIELQSKTIILKDTFIALIEISLKLEEINHAAFFLMEMENNNYPIVRHVLELFMDLQITQLSLKNQIKNQKMKKKEMVNKFDHYSKYLINPNSDNFIKSPDYFYYNSKKLSYKSMNIESTLKTLNALNIGSAPFFPKDSIKSLEKNKEVITKDIISLQGSTPQEEMLKDSEESKNNVTNALITDGVDKNDILKKIEIKLKDLNFSEIKEFYPKNFKIVAKTK